VIIDDPEICVAAYNGWVDEVKELLEKGADINVRCKQGKTPLSWAISKRYVKIVEVLLSHGGIENLIGYLIIVLDSFASTYRSTDTICVEIFNILLPYFYEEGNLTEEAQKIINNKFIHYSSQHFNVLFDILLDKGLPDINARDKRGLTIMVNLILHGLQQGSNAPKKES